MNISFLFGGIARALSIPEFRNYWAGNGISTIGRWAYRVAVGWLTWQLTESEAWLGIVAFADLFPMVVIPVFAGVIADRAGYVRLMRWTVLGAGLATALFAALVALGGIDIYLVVALSALIGTLEAGSGPARISVVHLLVPRREMAAAIALNTATFNLARMIGPAVAGGLLIWTNVATAIAFNAASYFIFLAILMRLNESPVPRAGGAGVNMAREIWQAVRYIVDHPGVRIIMILIAATALLIRPVIELLPGFAVEVFGRGPGGLSTLLSSIGLGASISGLWLARRGDTRGLTRLVVWSFLLTALSLLAFAATGIFWFGVGAIVAVGFFLLIGGIGSQSLVQNVVAPELRARVLSIYLVTSFGLPSVGALIIGWIASLAGLQATTAAGAGLAVLIWFWARPVAGAQTADLERRD
jgi:MFS family permease